MSSEFTRGAMEIVEQQPLSATAEEIWSVVGGFNNLPDFDPSSRWSTLEYGGRDRRVGVNPAGEIVERLVHFDEAQRTYSYIITETIGLDMPFTNYYSTIAVIERPDGVGCMLDWRGWADPKPGRTSDEVETELRGIYRGIAGRLVKRFGAHT
jgi:hypothetical protein